MTINTLPEASAIRLESRLKPEQVSLSLASDDELEWDIADRIEKYRAVIEKKIDGVSDSADNQLIAREALQLRVLASLFGSAGHLSPTYWQRGQDLKAESADLLDDLTGTSADVTEAQALHGFSNTPTRVDGWSDCTPEYSPC